METNVNATPFCDFLTSPQKFMHLQVYFNKVLRSTAGKNKILIPFILSSVLCNTATALKITNGDGLAYITSVICVIA